MAISKALSALVLISVLLLHLVEADEMMEATYSKSNDVPIIDCGAACTARCTLSSRQNLCKRACGTCCARCNCVPPGTSGNQDMCPCYYAMTTHSGRRKCP